MSDKWITPRNVAALFAGAVIGAAGTVAAVRAAPQIQENVNERVYEFRQLINSVGKPTNDFDH